MAQVALKQCTAVCLVMLAFACSVIQADIVSDSWIQIAIPIAPPVARHSHTAVWNLVNKNMVVFGGTNSMIAYNDISKFAIETSEWNTTVVASGVLPAPRFGHTAVVTGLNTMVVFGGRNATTLFADVAVYDLIADAWISVDTSGTPPSPRAYHTAVVDRYQHTMYVHGGRDDLGVFADLFALNLDTWTWSAVVGNQTVAVSAREKHSAVMTPLGVMVVFGGVQQSDVACFSVRNQTWYTCVTDYSHSPSVRYGHTAVISPLQQMVIFGGCNSAGNPVNDVWNFDIVTFKWSVVVPGGVPVQARSLHSSVATAFGSMMIFGGLNSDGTDMNDFGLYNLANTVLRSAYDGAAMVVLVTLLGTILISLCFAMDYMQEQSEIEKEEAIAKAKTEQLLLPKLPAIPKALQIPLGPRAQKFFDEFKMSLDPMADPPQ